MTSDFGGRGVRTEFGEWGYVDDGEGSVYVYMIFSALSLLAHFRGEESFHSHRDETS